MLISTGPAEAGPLGRNEHPRSAVAQQPLVRGAWRPRAHHLGDFTYLRGCWPIFDRSKKPAQYTSNRLDAGLRYITSSVGLRNMPSLAELPDALISQGRHWVSTAEAAELTDVPVAHVYPGLQRLRRRGAMFSPARGFHVVIPAPSIARGGCFPASCSSTG